MEDSRQQLSVKTIPLLENSDIPGDVLDKAADALTFINESLTAISFYGVSLSQDGEMGMFRLLGTVEASLRGLSEMKLTWPTGCPERFKEKEPGDKPE